MPHSQNLPTVNPNASTLKPHHLSRRKDTARLNDPHNKRQDILDVATKEFAEKGLTGARIDEIAALTKASKRMIYYYFGSKEDLYIQVLENVYRSIRNAESQLNLNDMPPAQALAELMRFTIDFKLKHPDYFRIIAIENVHKCEYLAQSKTIQSLNTPAIEQLRNIYQRGLEQDVFRPNLDPVHIHLAISALSTFNVSNQHTFSLIFKIDMNNAHEILIVRQQCVDMLLRYVLK